ncbi:MAG: hypothetical protein KKA73_15165 [Chloroflexi bacterium]|nr:hypothetical protein [Chloroflexota bacterium]MBU1749026.1 hypothetical protein [Chloroflexota bacterium]MBU1878560.1 hypothetical protein [Chloroflexota bacterium]
MFGKSGQIRKGLAVVIGALMLLLFPIAFTSAATPPEPTYGAAVVDGDYGEWDLSNDYFADMYRAANPNHDVLAKLYLRYDCSTQTLYALVLVEPGHPIDVDIAADNHFVKIASGTKLVDGNAYPPDGTLPDLAWIGLSADGTTATGWEASASLAVGTYGDLNVHTDVDDEETSAVANRAIPLVLDCLTAVELASINAHPAADGSVPATGFLAATVFGVVLFGGGLVRLRRRRP